ncbi:unnamed protein product, partial [marine sediment metagenome]
YTGVMSKFNNTYLKYDGAMTKEMFDQVIEKLNDESYKWFGGKDNDYDGFVKHGFITIKVDGLFNTATNVTDDYDQIHVSDILDWHDASKFEVGDRVKIIKEAKEYSNGWDNSWTSGMSSMIGHEFEIITNVGIKGYSVGSHNFPSFVLEKVEENSNLKIENLVKGEYYYHKCISCDFIIRFSHLSDEKINGDAYVSLYGDDWGTNYENTSIDILRKATDDERKWLYACIKADEFVEKDEALKITDSCPFVHGDSVTCTISNHEITDAKISFDGSSAY